MNELNRVPIDDLPEVLRARAEMSMDTVGDTRFLQVLANAPHMADFYFGQFYQDVFYGGVVPVRVKELVRLRLSNLHGCVY